MSGSRKWPATAWRQLLKLALPALDTLPKDIHWTLGGGTALALKLNHRISYDVDIFFEDGRALRLLSPKKNKLVRWLTDKWQEPGHYIKLEREEGAIDFLIAPRQTDLNPWQYDFEGRTILIDPPAEILAKKLRFRSSVFTVRDIFDLLALNLSDPGAVSLAASEVAEAIPRVVDRIRRTADLYRDELTEQVNPTSTGAELLEVDPLEAAELLERIAGRSPAPV